MLDSKIQKQIEKQYNKLTELGYNVVGVFLYGSQNYELNHEKSDVDTKAIVIPSLQDIIKNRQPVSKTIGMSNQGLCDVKDIRLMFDCIKKQNINFVEILFTKYYKLNPKYAKMFKPMFLHAEEIARYNNYAAVNCICGMAMDQCQNITKPFGKPQKNIDRYGFFNKHLSHILRLKDFLPRYCNGEPYRQALVPTNKEELIKLKTTTGCDVTEIVAIAEDACTWIQKYKEHYMQTNPVIINHDVETIMENVTSDLITSSLREELIQKGKKKI